MSGESTPPMGFLRKLALGAGDFGFNLYWQMASFYLLYFYTDVLGLPPATAGAIYMSALVWDALADPLIGMLADRTRSRYGRYRPYLLFGGPPLTLCFLLMFVGPGGGGTLAVAFAAATHVAFRSAYAVINIPYASLFARVTRDARVRADLTGFRMVCAALGAVVVAGATLPLVKALGTADWPRRGWVILAALYGITATLVLFAVAWAAKGYDGGAEAAAPRPPLRKSLRALPANGALMIVLGAVVISSFCSTLFGKNLLYYFKYVLNREDLASGALAMLSLLAALTVPFWAWVARRWGKRRTWLYGAVPGVGGLLLWQLVDGASIPGLFAALVLIAAGTGSYITCFWSMLPDTVEYGEWRSGVRTESLVFGLAVLGQKAALGLGAGFLGLALSHIGYVANAAQAPATLAGLKALMFWIPCAGGLAAAALVWFYPMDNATHARIVREIADRAAAAEG